MKYVLIAIAAVTAFFIYAGSDMAKTHNKIAKDEIHSQAVSAVDYAAKELKK